MRAMTVHACAQNAREATGISFNVQAQQLASAPLAWVLFLAALPLNAYACHAKSFINIRLRLFGRDARLQLRIAHEIGIHRTQLLADFLLDLHGIGA